MLRMHLSSAYAYIDKSVSVRLFIYYFHAVPPISIKFVDDGKEPLGEGGGFRHFRSSSV